MDMEYSPMEIEMLLSMSNSYAHAIFNYTPKTFDSLPPHAPTTSAKEEAIEKSIYRTFGVRRG